MLSSAGDGLGLGLKTEGRHNVARPPQVALSWRHSSRRVMLKWLQSDWRRSHRATEKQRRARLESVSVLRACQVEKTPALSAASVLQRGMKLLCW